MKLLAELTKAQDEYDAISIPNEEQVEAYYNLRVQLNSLNQQFRGFITNPKYLVPFLQPGRMVYVSFRFPRYLVMNSEDSCIISRMIVCID